MAVSILPFRDVDRNSSDSDIRVHEKQRRINLSHFWVYITVLSNAFLFVLLLKMINEPTNTFIFGIKTNDNSTRSNTKHKLCVAVHGTTIDERYKTDTVELLNIYKDRADVYFFLDDFGNELDYKLCDILSDPKRCIWLKPKVNHTETHSNGHDWAKSRSTGAIATYKTRSVFNKIKKMRLYDKCEYIMKLDSDAYVDVNRFGDWLSYNFNSSHDLYFGMTMGCFGWQMAQGIYTVSSGVFSNREDFEFNETTIKNHRWEDCSFGYLMTEILKIPIVDNHEYLIYGGKNQTETEIEWNSLSYFEKQCRFSCHKCTGEFRELFVRETNYMPLHVDHCRHKGYNLAYSNETLPAEFSSFPNWNRNRTRRKFGYKRNVQFEKR